MTAEHVAVLNRLIQKHKPILFPDELQALHQAIHDGNNQLAILYAKEFEAECREEDAAKISKKKSD